MNSLTTDCVCVVCLYACVSVYPSVPWLVLAFQLVSKRKMYCSGLTDAASYVYRIYFSHHLHPRYGGPPLFREAEERHQLSPRF